MLARLQVAGRARSKFSRFPAMERFMERMINYAARLSNHIIGIEPVRSHPLTLIDVGCSGGLHPIFERFGPDIRAHGFDPIITECERLAAVETRPHVHYHAAAVASSANPACGGDPSRFFAGFADTSAAAALERQMEADIRRNTAPAGALSPAIVGLDDFMAQQALFYLDFLKVDVDGRDLDVLRSGIRSLEEGRVGAVAVEVTFIGPGGPDDNTFHNLDRLLRQSGMELANLEPWRYSLKELPSRFNFRAIGETEFGPPFQGDAIYFNPNAPGSIADRRQRAAALLKQAAILDLFRVPDCAAKLLLRNGWVADECEGSLAPLLDALVPGGKVSYLEYVSAFRTNVESFFPREDPRIPAFLS